MIKVVNKHIATEVFPVSHITSHLRGGLALIDQKYYLTKLRVVLPSLYMTAGGEEIWLDVDDIIYVASDQYVMQWAKKECLLADGETPFILVPNEHVVMIERNKN